ncbi:hypothetical protein ACL6C3_04710 [Capilliphycus salinus ALCB114379]|uniref:hypothetical protein n=1 Tax=Capilliphycus salinus TaxID=2768948 RepID=UPI0039A5C200
MISEPMECPKCSKHTLIQRHSDLYQCVSCDFERDFSETVVEDYQPEDNDGGGIWVFFLVVFTIFALL